MVVVFVAGDAVPVTMLVFVVLLVGVVVVVVVLLLRVVAAGAALEDAAAIAVAAAKAVDIATDAAWSRSKRHISRYMCVRTHRLLKNMVCVRYLCLSL